MKTWKKSENSESVKPPIISTDASGTIQRRNYKFIEATEEVPEHWTWEELQLTKEQYEIYQVAKSETDAIEDAIFELALLVSMK